MTPVKALRLLSSDGTGEVGTIALREGTLEINIGDEALANRIREIAFNPLPYLRDAGDDHAERTVKAVAVPGTEEHLRILIFELRKLGLESRIIQ